MSRIGLRGRLFFLVLVAVLPGLALILHTGIERRRLAGARAHEAVERIADLVAEHNQRTVDLARAVLIGLAHTPEVQDAGGAGCSRAAAGILEHFPALASLGAAGADARFRCGAGEASEAALRERREHVERAVSTGRLALGGHQAADASARPVLTLAYPIVSDGATRGATFGAIDLAAMQAELDALSLPPDAAVTVTDRTGVVLARRPDGARWAGRAVPGHLAAPLLAGGGALAATDLDGTPRLLAFRRVSVEGDAGLLVAAGLPEAVAGAPETTLFRRALSVYLAACAAALVLAILAGEYGLVRNVRAVIAAARRLSAGDYGARTNRAAAGGELGELAAAFDEMAGNLGALTRENLSILESAADGIMRLDVDGRVTYANPAATRLLGVSAVEVRGRKVRELACRSAEGCRGGCALAASVGDGVPHQGVDEGFRDAEGHRFAVEFATTPVHDGTRLTGAVVVFRDVTERRRLEERLRHAEKVEALGKLAGGVAHDFNNILAAILGCARFVRDDLPPDHPSRPDVEEILASGARGAALTRQLLTFTRRELGEARVVDLGVVVSGLERFLARLIGEDVAVRLDVAPGCRVKADPGQLEQVVVNLAVNARDAMPRGGRLTIAVRPVPGDDPERPDLGAEGLVALTVADTGDGMDARTLPRVFEPFFTTKPPGKGTGLGLSTVYGIVAQGGGTVRVRSAPGEGTTFTVYLPRSRDEEEAGAPAPPRARGGGGRVLLVEDDDVLRAIERRALAAAGYRVTDAARPSDALALARGGAFDLLVTDVILPELSGPELAARVLAEQPGMRVLYTSGYTDRRLTAEELRAPGVAFLAKPFTPDVLLARVGDILDAPARRATG